MISAVVRGGLIALAVLVCAGPASAQLPDAPLGTLGVANQLVVTTNGDGDDGACTAEHCSLREAVTASNATTGVRETIAFEIPGPGTHVIAPQSGLPQITDPVDLDGFTQAGSSANTLASASNAVQTVVIRGDGAIPTGLDVEPAGAGSLIRGLAIHAFTTALELHGSTVEGSSLGFDPATLVADTITGVNARATGTLVGGTTPAARNVVAGRTTAVAVNAVAAASPPARIEGNLLNVTPSGSTAFDPDGAQQSGVTTNAGATIGGTAPGAGNVITGEGFGVLGGATRLRAEGNTIGEGTGGEQLGAAIGVRVNAVATGAVVEANRIRAQSGIISTSTGGSFAGNALRGFGSGPGIRAAALAGNPTPSTGNVISQNAIAGFALLPISLKADDTALANDEDDADTGQQNKPTLTSSSIDAGTRTVAGTLSSKPSTTYVVEVFSSRSAGDAEQFVGAFEQTTDADGDLSFSQQFTGDPGGVYVRATARDKAAGDTSELSSAVVEPSVPVVASVTAPATTAEDAATTVSVSASDPHGDPLTYSFDCDNDGTFELTGAASSRTCTWASPGVRTIAVQVSDGTDTATSSTTTTVTDVPPSVTLSGPATVDEGSTVAYAYTVGHGTVSSESCGTNGIPVADGTSGTITCRFEDGPATSDVKVTVADDDAADDDTVTVTVADVAPAVELEGPSAAPEGSTATYTWTVTDPGTESPATTESCGAGATLVDTSAPRSFDCRFGGGASSAPSLTATSDGVTRSDSVTVAIGNFAPAATGAAYDVDEDVSLTVAAPGVLAGDTDPGGDALTAELVDGADHGTLALAPNGSFTYTPAADFAGIDTFRYRAGDGAAKSSAAVVTLTVRPVDEPAVETPKQDEPPKPADPQRSAPPPPAPAPAPPPQGFLPGDPGAARLGAVGTVGPDGWFTAQLTNPNPFPLNMRLTAYMDDAISVRAAAPVRAASAASRFVPGQTRVLRLKLKRAALRALRRRGRLRVTAAVKLRDPFMAVRTVRVRGVTLKLRRPPR